ncbi:hypothetical protein CYMTET_31693 [Cymbomonas tetramitiformis]|uniref:Uncharacterized protein n=1 Tax=Cymbomonas tetramitiformis TaxID=36881 RepID=A0AAE0FH20_9CHLO|nr:hypothetical protein CYMTET_31693 [Cymbomonas tetramitiformis]
MSSVASNGYEIVSDLPDSRGQVWKPLETFVCPYVIRSGPVGFAKCCHWRRVKGSWIRCSKKVCSGSFFCMSEHHEAACRVVASIKGGGEAFVQQCRRLKQSNDEQVLESICDTVCERVTKKCYVASLASDREAAFDTVDMTTLNELNTECSEFVDSYQQSRSAYFKQQESPVDNLTSKFATASISPVAGVVKKVPRSRDSSRQGTPQPSKAPSVADGDVPDQAARIVTLQRVSELEAELVLKANRVIKLEAELKLKETRMTELAAERDGFVKEADLSLQKGQRIAALESRLTEVQVKANRVTELESELKLKESELESCTEKYRSDVDGCTEKFLEQFHKAKKLEQEVASRDARIAELKAAQLAPAAAVTASTSRKGSKKQLEIELDAANKQLVLLQKQNEVLIRDSTVEICQIDDLENILDGPLNHAGYDWSLSETDSETLAKVFIFAVDTDAEPDADDPTDGIKLGTTDSPRSGTPSEYACEDPKDELGFAT